MNGFTDWHRLFGITLTDFFTGTAYTVELEKDLSLKKQFLDVVIIEKKEGQMPDELPDGFENMGKHNLISYKSLHEPFDGWSADELAGHYVNYRKQVSPSLKKLLPEEDFRLYAVCTRYPAKLAKQAELKPVAEGVYDFRWGSRDIRLIVISVIAKKKRNAMWLMLGMTGESAGYGLSNYKGRLHEMSGVMECLFIRYRTKGIIKMAETLEKFRERMRQRGRELMTPTPEDIVKAFPAEEIFRVFPAEEIFRAFPAEERLRGLPAEERLRGLPAEERLRGLPAEERLKGLSPEEIRAYLKKLPKKVKPAKKKGTTLKKSA